MFPIAPISRRIVFALFLAFATSAFSAAVIVAQNSPDPPKGKRWALLVGIDKYNAPIPTLRYSVDDVRDIGDALVQYAGYPRDNVKVMTSLEGPDSPTSSNVIKKLQQLEKDIQPEDSLLLYFSGHGFSIKGQEGEKEKHYLATINADLDDLEGTALSLTRLQSKLSKIRAHQIVFIVDACRNRPELPNPDLLPKSVPKLLSKGLEVEINKAVENQNIETATLLACSPGQSAFEWPEKGHSVFSWYLLQGLKGKMPGDPSQPLKASLLFDYVSQNVTQWAIDHKLRQTPKQHMENSLPVILADRITPMAILNIVTNPPGARVWVNGQEPRPGQVTPLTLDIASARLTEFEVLLQRKGYKPKTVKVALENGTTTPLPASDQTLEPDPALHARLGFGPTPPDAKVFVDKQPLDKSKGYVDVELEPGVKETKVEGYLQRPGIRNIPFSVSLEGGQVKSMTYANGRLSSSPPLPTSANLNIETVPRGARVFVDGVEQVGKLTPCLIDVSLGLNGKKEVSIEIKLKGYHAGSTRRILERGQVSDVKDVQLARRLPAHLVLESDPPGATVKVDMDGEETKVVTTPTTLDLDLEQDDPKKARVTLELEGYQPKKKQFDVQLEVGKTSALLPEDQKLIELPTQLGIESRPSGAKVFVDGVEQVGKRTPVTLDLPIVEATKQVQITLQKEGYRPATLPVSLLKRKTTAPNPVDLKELAIKLPSPDILLKVNPKDDAEMVFIPEGKFTLGAGPGHMVQIKGYWIYRQPVTVAQYRTFCKETFRKLPPQPDGGGREDDPVVNVNWDDADEYARWAGMRLPTEAEWEKAARGKDGREYPWGAWGKDKSPKPPSGAKFTSVFRVGSFPELQSPYGMLDTAGNVSQWCADWFDKAAYQNPPNLVDPAGPAQTAKRVYRGGAWNSKTPQEAFRVLYREGLAPDARSPFLGFRCASDK